MKIFDFHTHTPGKPDSLFNVVYNNKERAPKEGLYSVGLHPWFELKNEDLSSIEELLKDVRCKAIGETGLDRVRDENFSQQKDFFNHHIDLAIKYDKPIILHCVKAYQDIIEILLKNNFKNAVIFHDYNGNDQITERLLKEKNLFFSYGDKLFKENSKGFNSLNLIPNERLLIETDESKYSIQEFAQQLATLRQLSIQEISTICFNNSKAILKF